MSNNKLKKFSLLAAGAVGAGFIINSFIEDETIPPPTDANFFAMSFAMTSSGEEILAGKGENDYLASVDACEDRNKCWFFSSLDEGSASCVAIAIVETSEGKKRFEKKTYGSLKAKFFERFVEQSAQGRPVISGSYCNYTP